jgi:hypothetical protein
MTMLTAAVTTSLDGCITGPNDGPGVGLGEGKVVNVMGGADTIRQALRAGYGQELSISIAPLVLGGGQRLFEGFDETINLEPIRVLQSPFATHITNRVARLRVPARQMGPLRRACPLRLHAQHGDLGEQLLEIPCPVEKREVAAMSPNWQVVCPPQGTLG